MKRRLDYSAPVLPIEYDLDDDPIWPCPDCLPWHVEIVREPDNGASGWVVREWHAVDCPALTH